MSARSQDSHSRISNCKDAGSTLKKESQTLTGGPAHLCTVKFSRSDFEMQRFESRRLNQPVRLKRVKYEGRSKTAPYREYNVRRVGALRSGAQRMGFASASAR